MRGRPGGLAQTRQKSRMKSIPIINEKAAGIDVGSESLHVSIGGEAAKIYGTVTSQLHALRDWLVSEGVTSVALEATGVYWLCLYEVLENAGLEVLVVNGKHVRNLPGRKTDIADCQWLATLHAHGLLRSGFVPEEGIRRMQDYVRLRADHITMAASHVQHMQKAMERMNIKLQDVISSVTGVSGLAVIRAILEGERDPQVLLGLCDKQIRRNKAQRVIESLRGTWKREHLFALRQALSGWEFYQQRIQECDEAIAAVLREQTADSEPPSEGSAGKSAKPGGANAPQIEGLHGMLMRLCAGKDPTTLPAITDYSLLEILSEVGTDLTRWKTEKHFTAWLGLAPGSKQSGKRRGNFARKRNRAGRIFCLIARSLARSVDKGLGGFYRRLRARRGGLIANQALARKLAALFWRFMVHGGSFVEKGLKDYEQKVLQSEQALLAKLARKHGLCLSVASP
jgi:transposase